MSTSLLGDLNKRVQRFGKSSKSVPGTYMSAAGIQSEIHPTTLARLAVHETMYRRQVHVYQQDLANTVYTIRRDQRLLRKSVEEYKRTQRHNKKHRYVPPLLQSPPSGDPISQQPDSRKVILSPLDVSQLDDVTDSKFMTDSKDTFQSTEEENEEISLDRSDGTKRNMCVDFEANAEVNQSKVNERKRKKPKTKVKDKSLESLSELEEPVDDSKEESDVTRVTKSEGDTAALKGSSTTEIFPNMEVIAKKPHKVHQSDTSSFMELVRMKNKSGLTKNLKVIDKLVNESRNKRFAYLTKVTTIREGHMNSDVSTLKHQRKTSLVELPQIKLTFQNNDTESIKSNKQDLDKTDSFTQPEQYQDSVEKNALKATGSHYLALPVPTGDKLMELHRSRRLSIPAKQVDKFLLEEKIKSENYKDDIRWQHSLASIRDVHYIRNKNDYEEFALSVLQKAEENYKQ